MRSDTSMITDEVIREIYKKFKKPNKRPEDLNLYYYVDLLKGHHDIALSTPGEVVIGSLEEFNPFRRFLVRSLTAILEFDKMIAFVFPNHILFLSKDDDSIRVHIRPEEKKGFLSRLFGR